MPWLAWDLSVKGEKLEFSCAGMEVAAGPGGKPPAFATGGVRKDSRGKRWIGSGKCIHYSCGLRIDMRAFAMLLYTQQLESGTRRSMAMVGNNLTRKGTVCVPLAVTP